jgi:transketolase
MCRDGKSSHVGSNFSMIEILVVLYKSVLRIDPSDPEMPTRDRFILSKGHASAGLYAVLAECGFFPLNWLDSFYLNGSVLMGHASHREVPGVEVSTGSLGHGLPLATGMALAAKRDRTDQNFYVLLSDGECDEGTVWEAALFAGHHSLDNLTVIVDYNKIQAMAPTKDVLDLEPLVEKWASFGWRVREVDGHDVEQLLSVFSEARPDSAQPMCVIAHTTKGKGVSFMEDTVLWHYRSPQGDEYDAAILELEARS